MMTQVSAWKIKASEWKIRRIYIVLLAMSVVGCAGLGAGSQAPEVHLTSIRPLPGNGFEQRFLIGLNIINPNKRALRISGMTYHLSLNDNRIASGVAGDIAAIPGFSESRISLEAGTNLISSLRFISELLQQNAPEVRYAFEVSMHSSWWPMARQVSESGTIKLSDYKNLNGVKLP